MFFVFFFFVSFIENAEADSFFCFTNIMAEIRDNFIKTLDDSDLGIGMYKNDPWLSGKYPCHS